MTDDVIMEFDAVVSPFDRKAVIQIGVTFGIPFGMLLILIALYGGADAKYALSFVLAIIVLSFVAGFLMFRRKHVRFSLYDDRIVRTDLPRSVRKAEAVAGAAVLAGASNHDPTSMGTGMLVQTRHVFPMKWASVTKAVVNDDSVIIGCKGDEMRIPCEGEMRSRILKILEEKVPAERIICD